MDNYYIQRAKELSLTWEGISDLLEMYEQETCELEKKLIHDTIMEEIEEIDEDNLQSKLNI